jgi:hypothetical protein
MHEVYSAEACLASAAWLTTLHGPLLSSGTQFANMAPGTPDSQLSVGWCASTKLQKGRALRVWCGHDVVLLLSSS